MPQSGSFVLRYQRRLAGQDKTGGNTPIKPVLGWETWEEEVKAGKLTSLSVNGTASEAKLLGVVRNPSFISSAAAEYRNIVLIPIE